MSFELDIFRDFSKFVGLSELGKIVVLLMSLFGLFYQCNVLSLFAEDPK